MFDIARDKNGRFIQGHSVSKELRKKLGENGRKKAKNTSLLVGRH